MFDAEDRDLDDEAASAAHQRRGWLQAAGSVTWMVLSGVIALTTGGTSSWAFWLIVGLVAAVVYLGYKWAAVWFEGHDWFYRPDFQTLNLNQPTEEVYYEIISEGDEKPGNQ